MRTVFQSLTTSLLCPAAAPAFAQYSALRPMEAPPENPMTAEKALLGKFLFWEEQLSSDDSTACGTCHIPEAGGSDPRSVRAESVHPGDDGVFGTDDDIRGSIGVLRTGSSGDVVSEAPFDDRRQVTRRRSMPTVGAGYSREVFWDGRASGEFINPDTGLVWDP